MTTPRLLRIEVENFRSINQRVDVPLDAPVVLIHGSNGAGKTSLLHALELSLTGRVPSLEQADRGYAAQLLHRGAAEGRVRLTVSGLEDVDKPVQVRVGKLGSLDRTGLNRDRAHFFSERCYLPQARLGRLLEVYQTASDGTHSPLTRFVHDLLQLDRLDALIDGLEPTGNVTRIRKLVPQYAETERMKQRLVESLAATRSALSEAETRAGDLTERLAGRVRELFPDAVSDLLAPERRADLGRRLADASDAEALVRFAEHERALALMRRRWERVVPRSGAKEGDTLENALIKSRDALGRWRASEGERIEAAIKGVRSLFPDLATPPRQAPGSRSTRRASGSKLTVRGCPRRSHARTRL